MAIVPLITVTACPAKSILPSLRTVTVKSPQRKEHWRPEKINKRGATNFSLNC